MRKEKVIKEIEQATARITQDRIDTMRRMVEETNTKLNSIYKDLDNLKENNDYNKEYIVALNFLSWFNWDKLYSRTLVNEAKNKLLKELDYTQQKLYGTTLFSHHNIDKDYVIFNMEKITDVTKSYIDIKSYNTAYNFLNDGLGLNSSVELINKQPKYEYKDYVKAVVASPWKFDKVTVYNVYKYLLEILEKDKTACKYAR